MQILTLIPRADSYGIVIFILLGFASFSLSNFMFCRWFHSFGILQINVVVKTLIVLWGCCILPVQNLFAAPFLSQLLAVPVGLGIGYMAVAFEKSLMRNLFRKTVVVEKQPRKVPSITPRNLFGEEQPLRREIGAKKMVSEKDVQLHWGHLMILAILEELIFRGFIVTFFREASFPYWIKSIAILLSIAIFGLSHLLNGNTQMKSKLFFASLVTLSTLTLHTVTAALVAHLYFNHIAYTIAKKWKTT